jgi:hypothetical protein
VFSLGILEDIVSNPVLIGAVTLVAVYTISRSFDITEDAGAGTKSLLESIGGAVQKPFTFGADLIKSGGSWAGNALDSPWW